MLSAPELSRSFFHFFFLPFLCKTQCSRCHTTQFPLEEFLPLPANAPPHKALLGKPGLQYRTDQERDCECGQKAAKLHSASGWSNREQGGHGSAVKTEKETCGVCSAPLTGPYWMWSQTAGEAYSAHFHIII